MLREEINFKTVTTGKFNGLGARGKIRDDNRSKNTDMILVICKIANQDYPHLSS